MNAFLEPRPVRAMELVETSPFLRLTPNFELAVHYALFRFNAMRASFHAKIK